MKLHIGNLSKATTEDELRAAVVAFGEPSSVEIVKDSAGTSRGYGFAEFADDAQAKAALAGLDGKDLGGQTLRVGEARPRKGDAPKATPPAPQA